VSVQDRLLIAVEPSDQVAAGLADRFHSDQLQLAGDSQKEIDKASGVSKRAQQMAMLVEHSHLGHLQEGVTAVAPVIGGAHHEVDGLKSFHGSSPLGRKTIGVARDHDGLPDYNHGCAIEISPPTDAAETS
jgi:hypothetical protein